MGLDTTHGAWSSGSYSAFNEWRNAVALMAGFPPLSEMWGFGGEIRWECLTVADRRLVPLLDHSDCDGNIPPADCAGIADALEVILPAMLDDWLRRKTRQFIDECREAHAAGEPLEFM